MDAGNIAVWSLAGITLGTFCACIPGMHAAGILTLLLYVFGSDLGFDGVMPFSIALVCTYSIIGFIPMTVLSVPDEGLFFAVTPAQAMNRDGRAVEVILKGGIGVLAGVCLTSLVMLLTRRGGLVPIFDALRPHWHWMIWASVLFMIMSEWPQRAPPGLSPMNRFIAVWRNLIAGMLVFVLSGVLGMIVFFLPAGGLDGSFAGLMPLLCGMFPVPWLLLILGKRHEQIFTDSSGGNESVLIKDVLAGGMSGWLGGAVASAIPGVTSGVGGMLAGHAAAISRKDVFIIAQGAARGTYLAGGMLLMFSPGITATRGGCAMMVRSVHDPFSAIELIPAVAVALISSGAALLMAGYVYQQFIAAVTSTGIKRMALMSLASVIILNWIVTGVWGVCILSVAAMTGLWGISCGARRMNCLGCILVPAGCALSGFSG